MNEIKEYYAEALNFWDKAFTLSEEDKAKHLENITAESDLADLAISKKLANFVRDTLKGKTNVLDYGCGEGWAGMSLSKAGCSKVECAFRLAQLQYYQHSHEGALFPQLQNQHRLYLCRP